MEPLTCGERSRTMHTDAHGLLRPSAGDRLALSPARRGEGSPITRAVRAFWKFLQGASGLAFHGSRDTGHGSRLSYAQHLAHKYSRPNRCC